MIAYVESNFVLELKNVKDFLIPQIEEEFSGHHCKLLGKFSDGLAYILHEIGKS